MASTPETIGLTFSVIIPTIHRPMLERAIGSASSQLELGDEVIVVHDDAPHNDWGAWARAEAMKDARGSHLLFMDDDDQYLPGANDTIRKAIQPEPDRVHIFRMARTAPFNDVIWTSQDLTQPGQVSTQMIVVPNDPDRLGTWSPRYEGDFDFLVSTLAKHDKPPVWHEHVIAIQHPNGY